MLGPGLHGRRTPPWFSTPPFISPGDVSQPSASGPRACSLRFIPSHSRILRRCKQYQSFRSCLIPSSLENKLRGAAERAERVTAHHTLTSPSADTLPNSPHSRENEGVGAGTATPQTLFRFHRFSHQRSCPLAGPHGVGVSPGSDNPGQLLNISASRDHFLTAMARCPMARRSAQLRLARSPAGGRAASLSRPPLGGGNRHRGRWSLCFPHSPAIHGRELSCEEELTPFSPLSVSDRAAQLSWGRLTGTTHSPAAVRRRLYSLPVSLPRLRPPGALRLTHTQRQPPPRH